MGGCARLGIKHDEVENSTPESVDSLPENFSGEESDFMSPTDMIGERSEESEQTEETDKKQKKKKEKEKERGSATKQKNRRSKPKIRVEMRPAKGRGSDSSPVSSSYRESPESFRRDEGEISEEDENSSCESWERQRNKSTAKPNLGKKKKTIVPHAPNLYNEELKSKRSKRKKKKRKRYSTEQIQSDSSVKRAKTEDSMPKSSSSLKRVHTSPEVEKTKTTNHRSKKLNYHRSKHEDDHTDTSHLTVDVTTSRSDKSSSTMSRAQSSPVYDKDERISPKLQKAKSKKKKYRRSKYGGPSRQDAETDSTRLTSSSPVRDERDSRSRSNSIHDEEHSPVIKKQKSRYKSRKSKHKAKSKLPNATSKSKGTKSPNLKAKKSKRKKKKPQKTSDAHKYKKSAKSKESVNINDIILLERIDGPTDSSFTIHE